MEINKFKGQVLNSLGFIPTEDQVRAIDAVYNFLQTKEKQKIFILKGYAGTGKTSLVAAFVRTLSSIRYKPVLLAPTGRAAKVMSTYSGRPAFTVHKKIYMVSMREDGTRGYVLRENLHTNTVFFVDEASMIGNSGGLGGSFVSMNRSLLQDLVDYVNSGLNCKLIFIGDKAQLPPVGLSSSPALNKPFLEREFGLPLHQSILSTVTRQDKDSGILSCASQIRSSLNGDKNFNVFGSDFEDVIRVSGDQLEDSLNEAYDNFGFENTIIITRSNKAANQYNQEVRHRIKWQEEELSSGDYIMIVKNNYYWLPDDHPAGFIANGDMAEVLKVIRTEELFGFRFADVELRLLDYNEKETIEVKLLLDTISSESSALTKEQSLSLYRKISEDYMDVKNKVKRLKQIKNDKHLNALQVKFSYAVTCHKAQGGQWPAVFVDQGYLTEEMMDVEYLRWLYTAVTRAVDKLYLVNFNEVFFRN